MKKLFLFAAVMFSSILFSACSEDDNKESQTSQKLLKQIEEISADKTIYYDFSYDDQQRLAEVSIHGGYIHGDVDFTYTYTDDRISVKYNSSSGSYYDAAFILDHNGYVTEFDVNGTTRWRYEYENGYVSKKQDNNSVTTPYFWTYRWENGNLMEQRNSYSNSTTYTYTDKPNKLNINLFDAQFGLGNFNIFAHVVFLPTNFKGSIPSNYPASADNSNIYYEYDDEGYPTQIVGPNANYILTYY